MKNLINKQETIDTLKICKCNYDNAPCESCPLNDDGDKEPWYDEDGDCWIQAMHRAAELLSALPERKRGKWIRQRDKAKPLYGWFFCSECGAFIGGESNFCSECGADMREDDYE